MSVIPSLAANTKILSLRDIQAVDNFEARIPEIAEIIASHPTLELVSARSIQDIGDPMIMDAVIRNPHIQWLKMNDCELDSHMLLRILRDMPSLYHLELSRTRFLDVEVSARVIRYNIGKTKLRRFRCWDLVHGGDGVANAIADSLRLFSSLRELDFLNCHLTREGLCAIADALQGGISLKELSIREDKHDLSRDTADRLALAIEQNTSLKKFVLRVGTMPPAASHRLLQAFTQNKMLRHVRLTGLVFGNDDSQLPLLGGTDVNCSLLTLVLEAPKNEGQADVGTRQSIRPMLQYLGSLHSLKSLELAHWNFNAEAFQAVCDELKTLTRLELSGIHFDAERTRILCDFLSTNTSVDELDLSSISFDDSDTATLFEALKRSQSLTELHLRHDDGNKSLKHLAELIESNSTLEGLSFYNSASATHSYEDMDCVGNALKKNTALKRLWYVHTQSDNPMSERERQALLDGWKHNPKLQLSIVGDTNIPHLQEKEIALYSDRNRLLCPLLSAELPLPLDWWPRVFQRASTYQASQNINLDMLNFIVKEKCDLFQRVRRRDDSRNKSTTGKRKCERSIAGAGCRKPGADCS